MSGYSRSLIRIDDPYCYLALNVFLQAFKDMVCYYTDEGTTREIEEGEKSIRWMREMEGNFRTLAVASGKSLDSFHQLCLGKINEIKEDANERQRILQQLEQITKGRERDIKMGQKEYRQGSSDNGGEFSRV